MRQPRPKQQAKAQLDHELWLSESVAQADPRAGHQGPQAVQGGFSGQGGDHRRASRAGGLAVVPVWPDGPGPKLQDPRRGSCRSRATRSAVFQQQVELAQQQIEALAELGWPGC